MQARYITLAPLPYNGIAAQRAAILVRLALGDATAETLQADCNAPDPRKRISELRRAGHPIATCAVDRINTDGSVNRVGLYTLAAPDGRQPDFFQNTCKPQSPPS